MPRSATATAMAAIRLRRSRLPASKVDTVTLQGDGRRSCREEVLASRTHESDAEVRDGKRRRSRNLPGRGPLALVGQLRAANREGMPLGAITDTAVGLARRVG